MGNASVVNPAKVGGNLGMGSIDTLSFLNKNKGIKMGEKLYTYCGDYADEFDVHGMVIWSDAEWEYKKLEAQHVNYPEEIYFGSNECIVFESADEYINSFKIQEITEDEIKVMKKFVFDYSYSYGFVPLMEGNAPNEFYEKNGYCPD